jgi:hypothetical protein
VAILRDKNGLVQKNCDILSHVYFTTTNRHKKGPHPERDGGRGMYFLTTRRHYINQQFTVLTVGRLEVIDAMPNKSVDMMNCPETKARMPASKHEAVTTSRNKVGVFIFNP